MCNRFDEKILGLDGVLRDPWFSGNKVCVWLGHTRKLHPWFVNTLSAVMQNLLYLWSVICDFHGNFPRNSIILMFAPWLTTWLICIIISKPTWRSSWIWSITSRLILRFEPHTSQLVTSSVPNLHNRNISGRRKDIN